MKTYASDINSLFHKKHEDSAKHLMEMQYRRDKSQEEIAQSQEVLTVEYNRLRNKLEAEVRRLQCELEASRTMYQVNADQMGHDYRLLEGESSSNKNKITKKTHTIT